MTDSYVTPAATQPTPCPKCGKPLAITGRHRECPACGEVYAFLTLDQLLIAVGGR